MRYSEQLMEHIEYAFHAFCKIVLRHEAINAWRDLKRKEEREISLDYLMSERYFEPSVMDKSQPYGLTTGSAGGLDEPLRGIFRYRL